MPESTSELFHRLRDREGRPAVLKLQHAGREDTLRVEHNLLGKLRHPQLPGRWLIWSLRGGSTWSGNT